MILVIDSAMVKLFYILAVEQWFGMVKKTNKLSD